MQALQAQALQDLNWVHPTTRVIFHDYTLYSSTQDCYATVRLVLENSLDTGVLLPTKHIRLMYFTDFPEQRMIVEFFFYTLVAMYLIDNLVHFGRCFLNVQSSVEEDLNAKRYELRLTILRQAAFNSLFPYRPRVLMMQISKRTEAVHENRPEHIAKLNTIGRQIPVMHRKYSDFMKTNRAKANMYDPEEQVKHARELI